MRIAVFSDLHVEHSNIQLETKGADVVVFAGDIYALGQAKEGKLSVIDWMTAQTSAPVVFVPGNHDFEASDMARQWEYWKKASRGTNVHCLWDEDVVIEDIRFLGTPLFSNFESTGQKTACMEWARTGIYDMSVTGFNGQRLTPEHYNLWFEKSTRWLREELQKPSSYKNIVVSHFAPSKKLLSDTYPEMMTSAYWASSVEDIVALADIWISGHTHRSVILPPLDKKAQKGRMISNARGVSKLFNISKDPNFSRDFLFDTSSMMRLKKSPAFKNAR